MPGSPATPDHPLPRRIAYFAVGVLVSLSAGLANGLLLANLAQIQGALELTSVEGAWLSAAYSMSNVCTSFLLIKFRQQFGLQRIARPFLVGFVLLSGAQVLVHSYGLELAVRVAAGVIGSGFTPLGFFYIMQALPASARLGGMVLGVGLSQVALPLARAFSPALLLHGDITNLYIFEFGLSLACLGSMALLRLPPSNTARVLEKLDFLTVAILAPGVMMLVAALSLGRIIWWSTHWIGYALAASIVLIGTAMLIEHNRANPLLNTRWMTTRGVVRFALVAASVRVLLGEQNYGAIGLMTALGMGTDQLVTLAIIMTIATLAGVIASVFALNPANLVWPVAVAVALIAIGAWMDSHATNLTRPSQLYLSQSMIGFAAAFFLGPVMIAGILRALAKGPSHMVSFSAVFSLAQTLGGLCGTAMLGTFQVVREKVHSHDLVQTMAATDPQVALRIQQLGGAYGKVLGDPVLRTAEGAALLSQQTTREANVLAFNDVFMLIAILAAVGFIYFAALWFKLRRTGTHPLAEELAAVQRMRAAA